MKLDRSQSSLLATVSPASHATLGAWTQRRRAMRENINVGLMPVQKNSFAVQLSGLMGGPAEAGGGHAFLWCPCKVVQVQSASIELRTLLSMYYSHPLDLISPLIMLAGF